MVRKFQSSTGTILDKYLTFKAFTQDKNVTKEDLKKLLDSDVYFSGTARHISRHINCTEEVYRHMQTHREWFVRMVGHFCYRRKDKDIMASIKEVLNNKKEDVRVINCAVDNLLVILKKYPDKHLYDFYIPKSDEDIVWNKVLQRV